MLAAMSSGGNFQAEVMANNAAVNILSVFLGENNACISIWSTRLRVELLEQTVNFH